MSQYTLSAKDIRALLGVGILELKDETIDLPVWDLQVEDEISKVYSNLPTVFETLLAKKQANEQDPTNPPLTRLEAKIVGSTQVYGTYAKAVLIGNGMPQFAYSGLGDGKANYTKTPEYEKTLAGLYGTMSVVADNLKEHLKDYGENVPVTSYTFNISNVGLAVDPVTGD